MEPFRFAQPRRSGTTFARSRRKRARGRCRWLGTLAGTCLAAALAGWPVLLVGAGIAGGSTAGPSYVMTALQDEQARVVNPGPPTGLTATPGNAQVSLSWIPPASDGGAAITGYDVYEGTSSRGESATPVNGALITATGFTVTGLTNGTTYYFTVDAVNDADLHSAASAEASAAPVAPTTAPGAPSGLTATAGNGQVSLSWTAPASDGGAQITSYDVYEGTTGDVKTTAPAASSKGTSVTVKNLANGTTYYFKVAAVNTVGVGPASSAASATPAAAITKPGPPSGLTATPGRGQVTLSWTAPTSDGGAGISGYLVYQGTSPGGEAGTSVNGSPVSATSYTVTGLANGTTYYFKVAAVNDAKQQGNDSGEASATPVSAAASASATTSTSKGSGTGASGAPGGPTGLTATAGNAQVSLSWTAPASDGGSPLARYQVYLGTTPGTPGTPGTSGLAAGTPVKSVTGTSTVVTGLTNGTTYYFAVTAVNTDGTMSSASGEASAEPIANAIPASKKVPKPVIISLAAVAIGSTAGALTLGVRRLRPRSRPPLAPPQDVRAVPDKGRPGVVSIQEIGTDETYTVRFEPLPAAIITTIEELR
jgi:fibronectin type 3 domain-containing protein